MSTRTFAGSRHERSIVAESGLGIRILPPPPPGTVILPIGSGAGQFDATGTNDISDQLGAWLNNNANVPNGVPGNPTVVAFPALQTDGVTRAQYRIEGGLNAGVRLTGMIDVILDGGGSVGQRGANGAQLIEKSGVNASNGHLLDDFFKPIPDPILNPRGRVRGGGTASTSAANSNLVCPTQDFSSPAVIQVGDTIEIRPSADPASYKVRTVTAVAVGGDIHTITYSGASVGTTSCGFVINPDKQWNLMYLPTNTLNQSYTGSGAENAATTHADVLQRSRTMFIPQQCHRLAIRNFQMTGANPTVFAGTAGYQSDIESQDAIAIRGGTDIEVGFNTITGFWGNGIETQPFVLGDGSYEAPIGVWIHDNNIHDFGRQTHSLTYGGHFILEDNYIGESARSMIDSEPTTNRVDPALRDTVDGIYLISNTIGQHGLGMLALHDGISYVLVADNVEAGGANAGIGTSGIAVVDWLIARNNIDNGHSSSERWAFIESEFAGGTNIWIEGNDQQPVVNQGVFFHVITGYKNTGAYVTGDLVTIAGHKWVSLTGTTNTPNTGHNPTTTTGFWRDRGVAHNCTNYLVVGNTWGGAVESTDQAVTPFNQAAFVPFTLPVPAHYYRDLALANVAVDDENVPYADQANVNYLVGP